MKTVQNYIDDIFAENGVITQLGGRYTAEQHEYAQSVGKCLENPDQALGMLQADTGIGKSLGYLIPSAIYIALNPDFGDKKIVISTFTRYLQKQIIDHDLPFIKKILDKVGLNIDHLVITYRMGRQSFFSVERVKHKCASILSVEPDRKSELRKFIYYVEESCHFGSGLWLDYLEEVGELPTGITVNEICLLPSQINDNGAYEFHLEKVKSASIVITNHHTSIMANLTGLDKFEIHAMIFDEAHKLAQICFDYFNYRHSLSDIQKQIKFASTYSNLSKKAFECLSHLEQLVQTIKTHPRFDSLEYISEITTNEIFLKCKTHIILINNLIAKIVKNFCKTVDTGSITVREAEFIDQMNYFHNDLNTWLKENTIYTISAFGISSVRKNISIAYLNVRASQLFGLIVKKLTDRIILTSATLANAKQNISFSLTQNTLGLMKAKNLVELIVSPARYAEMQFVLMTKQCPSPISEADEYQTVFNNKWLANTALMIAKAKESGDNVLILTSSHAESLAVGEAIKDLNPLIHRRGSSIKEYIDDFKKPNAVLITCSGWEGLNLRKDDGEQLIYHVVITRIPFAPPNPIIEFATKTLYQNKGKSSSEILNIQWVITIQEVVSKLKQGFGRGTRSPDDFVTIWIADPRMPHSRHEHSNLILLNAVPKRFINNYLNAEKFLEPKKELIFI